MILIQTILLISIYYNFYIQAWLKKQALFENSINKNHNNSRPRYKNRLFYDGIRMEHPTKAQNRF